MFKDTKKNSLCLGRITLEERQKIEEMLDMGLNQNIIAKELHRDPSSIRIEVRRCGGVRKYNAQKAHEDAEEKERLRLERLSETQRGRRVNVKNLQAQVFDLQRQVNEIKNELKEFKRD